LLLEVSKHFIFEFRGNHNRTAPGGQVFGASVTSTRKVLGSPQEIIFIGKNADNHRIPGYPRIIWVTSVKLGIAKQPSASMQPNQWTVGKKYFTSSYPHHDIYTFCYWQIFWHSI
jgi:hypothetical protein